MYGGTIALYQFINMACSDDYEINLWDIDEGKEILHQVEVGEVENELENLGLEELMDCEIGSWDLCFFSGDNKEELTLNIITK